MSSNVKMNKPSSEKACMTAAVACMICCVASCMIGSAQIGLESANKCSSFDNKNPACPTWVKITNGLLGCVACLLCIFALIKMIKPNFMC